MDVHPARRSERLLLCLVTDRRALAASLGVEDSLAALRRQVAAAVDAGVDLVHVRERDLPAAVLTSLAGECVERAAGSSTRIVVNDRLDVALAAAAAGVHLRGDSITPEQVRRLAPGDEFLVGRSIRDAGEASAAASNGTSYVVFGTVFPTPSKPGVAPAGLEVLAAAARVATVPLLAIGGVSAEKLPEVAAAGADGVAAIRMFFDAARDPLRFSRRVSAWREAFDMHRSIS